MHHPEISLLHAYVSGDISAVDGLIIAAHLESCTHCRDHVNELEIDETEEFERLLESNPVKKADIADESDFWSSNYSALFADITKKPIFSALSESHHATVSITVNDKTFELPESLHSIAHLIGDWRSYGNKVFSAVVDLGEDQRVNLLYMSPDVQVPQHTHKGFESTLVLHGSFSDENGQYHVGDFIQTDNNVEHAPRTHANQDCLCLTTLTEPMMFTQGVARMFNLFGRGMYP